MSDASASASASALRPAFAPALAIETRGLTRKFGTRPAVQNLDLRVPRGAIYGFVGPNGAGKTTTIKLILGVLRPTAGSVMLDGERLTPNRRDLLRGVGALIEAPSLYPHLTGRENLDLTRRILNLSASDVADALAFVSLAAEADRLVHTYSLGMRQRLALALAWLGHPHVLLLDEPANGLDPVGIRELRAHLQRLGQDRSVTVFLSSHVLSEVEQVATDLGIIKEGRLLFQGTLHELRQCEAQRKEDTLEDLFLRVLSKGDEAPSDPDAHETRIGDPVA